MLETGAEAESRLECPRDRSSAITQWEQYKCATRRTRKMSINMLTSPTKCNEHMILDLMLRILRMVQFVLKRFCLRYDEARYFE